MLNMSKMFKKQATLWFIVVIVCVVITYYYQKSKAAENYQKMLEVAVKNCDLETMKSLAKKSRDASNIGKRALYYAVQRGCLEIVTFLLDEGVDINAINVALFDAASYGQLEVVKLLLKRGANPLVVLKGNTAKTTAIWKSLRPINRNNSKKPYDEIIDLLTEAEKNYKLEK